MIAKELNWIGEVRAQDIVVLWVYVHALVFVYILLTDVVLMLNML